MERSGLLCRVFCSVQKVQILIACAEGQTRTTREDCQSCLLSLHFCFPAGHIFSLCIKISGCKLILHFFFIKFVSFSPFLGCPPQKKHLSNSGSDSKCLFLHSLTLNRFYLAAVCFCDRRDAELPVIDRGANGCSGVSSELPAVTAGFHVDSALFQERHEWPFIINVIESTMYSVCSLFIWISCPPLYVQTRAMCYLSVFIFYPRLQQHIQAE